MNKVLYFTKHGLEAKQKEYDNLLASRPDAVKDLTKAREMGDLSENGYYKSARMKLSDIDRRLRYIKYLLKIAQVKEKQNNGTIDIGSVVTLQNKGGEKVYEIVGTYEANPKNGKISSYSPLGKILLGKKTGDTVEFLIGDSKTVFYIHKVS